MNYTYHSVHYSNISPPGFNGKSPYINNKQVSKLQKEFWLVIPSVSVLTNNIHFKRIKMSQFCNNEG